MTPATLQYLLTLALREKEAAAKILVETGETSVTYGQAAFAVRQILDELNKRAV